ncbi:MAG: peroxiredoxin [Candidatus Delongbacteria bacterium]
MALTPGEPVPGFLLEDEGQLPLRPEDFRGRWWVCYAYPKDNTPGCTQEARDFSGLLEEFRALGAEVVGVSPDKPASHRKFIDGQGLGLRLLSDPEHVLLEPWGAWGLKKFMGREYQGVKRSTWLVDPAGRLAEVWTDVKVKGHAEAVLASLRARLGR